MLWHPSAGHVASAQPASVESLASIAELEDGLRARTQTAATFDAQQVPLSSFMLNGHDYTSARALQVCLSAAKACQHSCSCTEAL